jgi:hypothetical protein
MGRKEGEERGVWTPQEGPSRTAYGHTVAFLVFRVQFAILPRPTTMASHLVPISG